jgi:hypothetical protein
MANAKIDMPGLGKVVEVTDSPPGDRFWAGAFDHRDDGALRRSVFYLSVRGEPEPSPAQLEFARTIMSAIDRHIDGARRLLGERLRAEPGFFGVDAATATAYLERGAALLPFDVPEPTFYDPEAWQIRFAESPLPRCQIHGVSVTFSGATPVQIDDLSESTPI